MRVAVRESCEDGVDVAFMSGHLHGAHVNEILRLCISYLRHEKLVIDLVDVESISAHALDALIQGQAMLEQAGCEVEFRSVSPRLRRTFELNHAASNLRFQ